MKSRRNARNLPTGPVTSQARKRSWAAKPLTLLTGDPLSKPLALAGGHLTLVNAHGTVARTLHMTGADRVLGDPPAAPLV